MGKKKDEKIWKVKFFYALSYWILATEKWNKNSNAFSTKKIEYNFNEIILI